MLGSENLHEWLRWLCKINTSWRSFLLSLKSWENPSECIDAVLLFPTPSISRILISPKWFPADRVVTIWPSTSTCSNPLFTIYISLPTSPWEHTLSPGQHCVILNRTTSSRNNDGSQSSNITTWRFQKVVAMLFSYNIIRFLYMYILRDRYCLKAIDVSRLRNPSQESSLMIGSLISQSVFSQSFRLILILFAT